MGPEVRYVVVSPANLHLGTCRAKTNVELFIAIEDGLLFSPMPAWRYELTKDQTKYLVAYIWFIVPVRTIS